MGNTYMDTFGEFALYGFTAILLFLYTLLLIFLCFWIIDFFFCFIIIALHFIYYISHLVSKRVLAALVCTVPERGHFSHISYGLHYFTI